MKYIIKLNDGNYIVEFRAASMCVTHDINKAGKYPKNIAIKRIEKWGLNAELIISE